jgi:hypothetical protein
MDSENENERKDNLFYEDTDMRSGVAFYRSTTPQPAYPIFKRRPEFWKTVFAFALQKQIIFISSLR